MKNTPLKHLIIFCHPNPRSLSAAYKDELVYITEKTGNEVIVRDLYNLEFRPVLTESDLVGFEKKEYADDVKIEQDYIREADLITFIYPIWWGGMPAMMKGYVDRVFSKGFAYEINGLGEIKKGLEGKKVVILNNFGSPYETYEKSGMLEALKLIADTGIFRFCGMEVVEHHFFGRIDISSEEECSGHLRTLNYMYEKFLDTSLTNYVNS